jgi:hypothetical protein
VATQRRFEADTLAEVLAKVQAEVGSDAKIASAQKVRSGGAFGFFQKERFEVLVDIPDQLPAPAMPQPPGAQPHQALLDDRTEWLASLQKSAGAPNNPTATISGNIEEDDDDDKLTPASLLELAQQVNNEERAKEQTVSTESGAFADVLSRMAFQADMRDVPRSGPSATLAPSSPEDAVVQDEDEYVVDEDDEAEEVYFVEEEQEEPVIPERPAFLDEPLPKPAPAPKPVAKKPAPAPEPTTSVARTPEPLPPVAQPLPPAPLSRSTAAAAVQLAAREAAGAPAMRTRITDHPLASLGLPAPYIPADVFDSESVLDLRTRLVDTLTERLPRTPVVRPSRGSIIAVVGQRDEAQKIALDIAREFGRPKEEIALASQHAKGKLSDGVITSVENAEDAQRSWSRRKRITIITIEARPGSLDTAWAEHVLTALEPIATFGVVEATRKAEDIASWADALGGVDCLAINNIEETVSPASVLQTGIPIERIDGRKATPEFWALLLTERLPAA